MGRSTSLPFPMESNKLANRAKRHRRGTLLDLRCRVVVQRLEDRTVPTQIVDTTLTPVELAQSLVGPGVAVENVTFNGAVGSTGSFDFSDPKDVGFGKGILLSSGSAASVVGPNLSDSTSTDFGSPGDADLDALSGFPTFDAAVLEFDFIPTANQVVFYYAFASDEYSEWVNTPYNDVFAFYVNGTNHAVVRQIAGDPSSPFVPVAVNNINNSNPVQDPPPPPMRPDLFRANDYIPDGTSAINLELDGITTVLTFQAPVIPDEVNHMKLAIADASDPIYDSAVFIQAGSLVSNDNPVADLSLSPSSGSAPLVVTAFIEGEDPNGLPLTYSIDWGDGSPDSTGPLDQPPGDSEKTAKVDHTFTTGGTYFVTLTVSNGTLSGTSTEDVDVKQLTATWVGGGVGDPTAWSNPLNWSGGVVPKQGDKAIFTGPGTMSFTSIVDAAYTSTIGQVDIDPTWNGNLALDSALTVTGTLDSDSGSITGAGPLVFNGGTWTTLQGLVGTGGWTNTGVLTIDATAVDVAGTGTFVNSDVLSVHAGTPLFHATFSNLSVVEVLNGELQLLGPFTNFSANTLTGGTYKLTGSLKFTGADIVTNSAVLELTGPASQIYDSFGNDGLANLSKNASTGSLTLQDVRALKTIGNFTNDGLVQLKNAARFQVNGTYTQNSGMTALSGSGLKATGGVVLDGGALVGRGSIIGNVTNNSGTVIPGGAGVTGTIRVNGTYVQGPGGTLNIEIGSLTAFDQFNVLGTITLGGTMNVSLLGSYVPNNGDSFRIVTGAAGVTGTFATINGLVFGGQQFIPDYNLNDVTLVTAAFPAPPSGGRHHRIIKRSLVDVVSKRTWSVEPAGALGAAFAAADLDAALAP